MKRLSRQKSITNPRHVRGDYQATGNAVDVWARASLGALPDEVLEIELGRKIHDHQRHCQVKLAQGIRAYHQIQLTKPLNASGKQLRRQKTQRLPILIQVLRVAVLSSTTEAANEST